MAKKRRAPHGAIDEAYWDGLDNTAKMIPAITTSRSPNVYRLTAVLFEAVDQNLLQAALERALSIMPSFSVKLHRGLFWYYFDTNTERPRVKPERTYPCRPIYRAGERGFLFRVTYYERRINLEMYHALTDGLGAISFMRLLVYCYFSLKDPERVPEDFIRCESDIVARDFGEDSFVHSASECRTDEGEQEREVDAYRIGGYRYDGTRLGVLTALLPVDAMLALSKRHGATLSEYLSALLIWSIYNTTYRRSSMKRPISVSIPVNLRGMFDSSTLRNFFGHVNVSVTPGRSASFDDILDVVKKRFECCMTREYFERQINAHVSIERIPGIKFVPLVIKNAVMRYFFKKNARLHTITLSNLGRITLPPMLSGKVERFEVAIGASDTHVKKVSLCSYENNLALTFSSTVDNNSLEQFMLSYLAREGVDVVVSSNETPAPVRDKAYEKTAKRERKSEKRASKKAEKASKKADKIAAKADEKARKLTAKAAKKSAKAEKRADKKRKRGETL